VRSPFGLYSVYIKDKKKQLINVNIVLIINKIHKIF